MPNFAFRGVVSFATLLAALLLFVSSAVALDWQLESSALGDIPLPNSGDQQTANIIGDIDGDGLDDVVIAERTAAPAVVVYFREGGAWTREVIEPGLLTVEAGGALYDVDSDGDLDIVHGSDYQTNEVWWWENPGSRPYLPTGWTRRLIKNTGVNQHHDMVFGDFDDDGVDELAFWNQGASTLFLAEIPADPLTSGPWAMTSIFSGTQQSEGLIAVDVNLDGLMDLCGGGYWFEHVSGTNFVAWPVVNDRTFLRVAAGQLIPGGRPELVFSSGDALGRLSWAEWDGNAWIENILDGTVDHGHSLEVRDIDHDGRLDIFSAEMHTPGPGATARNRVFLNRGAGVFEAEEVSVGIGNHEAKLVDLDGDGWLDIMGKPLTVGAPGLNAWLQTPALSDVFSSGEPWVIGPGTGLTARAVHTVDVDSDGFHDLAVLLGGSAAEARYYRSPNWDPVVVAAADLAAGAWVDVDRDGDLDLLAVESGDTPNLIWFANPADGSGNWLGSVLRSFTESVEAFEFTDLQDDGFADIVLFTATGIEHVAENGSGGWDSFTITSLGAGNGGWVADIDRDGAQDIGRSGRWWLNPGGFGSWTEQSLPGGLGTDAVSWTADLDRDGWADVISLDQAGTGDLVYHASNRLGSVQAGYLLGTVGLADAQDLLVEDFDLDGDLDFVVSGRTQADGPLTILARSGGQPLGSWTLETAALATSVATADLDHDGAADLVLGGSIGAGVIGPLGLGFNQTTTTWNVTGWQRHLLDDARPWKSFFVLHGDIDRDGFIDVVASAFWYQNPGTPDGVWVRRAFGAPFANIAAVHDFDGDGDLDVLGTEGEDSSPNPNFVWGQNDGIGNFTIFSNVQPGTGSFLQGVAVGRFGLGAGGTDASLQVALSWEDPLSGVPDGIDVLNVPADPVNDTWTMGTLFPDSENEALSARDIDRDGDIDLALGRTWLRNEGGSWSQFSIASPVEDPDRNVLVDMNSDGRLDLLIGFEAVNRTGPVRWYEQPLVPTSPWSEHSVTNLTGPMSVDARDLDRDGEIDLVVGEHHPSNPAAAGFYVIENGGPDTWTDHLILEGDEHHDGTQLVDIDGDGDLDVISVGYVSDDVVLYENLAIGTGGVSDVVPPVLVSAEAWVEDRVRAEFSERVDLGTATDPANYTIVPAVNILSATLQADQRTVELEVAPLVESVSYSLAAAGVLDLASPPNASDGLITVPFEFVPPQRVSTGLVALYDFAEGAGTVVGDVSGVGTPLDLNIPDPGAVTWEPGGGLTLNASTLISSPGPATKLIDAAAATSAITVEAWVASADATQNGPARIVTCSGGWSTRNFTLGQGVHNQGGDRWVVRLRTTATNDNGEPETPTAQGSLTTDLTHVVYTRSATGAVSIYLDGVLASTDFVWGTLDGWDPSYTLALGNEMTGDRPWLGTYQLVAAYDRALSPVDIQQNFIAGPQGQTAISAPLITSLPVTTTTVNQPYVYNVLAQGFPTPTFSLSVMPAGMTIDPVTGAINWTPSALGDFPVEVTATNSQGFDTQAFTVMVQVAPNLAPEVAVTRPTQGAVLPSGDPVVLEATASDSDGSVVQVDFVVDGAIVDAVMSPPWTTTWLGGADGSHSVVAIALDDGGATKTSEAVTFIINDGLLQQYLFDIQVGAGTADRQDKPVDAAIDLTSFLAGVSGSLDLQSLQVVEVDFTGALVDLSVPFQFDPDPAFDPVANAAGNLVFVMEGATSAGQIRYYQLAFDVVGACPDCPPPPVVAFPVSVDSLTYENQLTYEIVTPGATYMYQKQGAGLASLFDPDAQDWISFRDVPGSKSAGEYRGIPNLVFRDGDPANSFFHPGFTNGTSQLVSAGPLKVTVRSQAGPPTDLWDVLWEFYPDYARMTVLAAGTGDLDPYWFLYEGTVGGSMDPGDVVVRSDGVQTSAYDYGSAWEEILAPPSWVYFRDTAASRALYFSDDLGDGSPDSYSPLGQTAGSTPEMTVFGFGRVLGTSPNSLEGRLNGVGRSFTLGFAEDYSVADGEIVGAADPLTVIVGNPTPTAPVITSIPLTGGTVGQPYFSTVTASGYPAPTFSLSVMPVGMTIDPIQGIISWIPTAVGDFAVEVMATNSEGFDTQAFTLSVQDVPNELPIVTVTSPAAGTTFVLGDPVPLAATAIDNDGTVTEVEFLVDGVVVATVTAPPWETVWNGGAEGGHGVIARATDNDGEIGVSPEVSFSINDPNNTSRVTAGLVTLYDFASGGGTVVPDVSGVGTPLDLQINDPTAVTWLPGGGLSLDTATIVRSAGPATKVIDAAASTNAMTVEAWVTPASVAQSGPARIVTCSTDPSNRNFTLGQGVYDGGDDRYVMRFRTTATDNNGTPQTSTAVGTLTTDLTHMVYTRNAAGQVAIYLDGVLSQSGSIGGTSSNWNAGYAFALGNELSEDRPWLGEYHLVAVFDRALTPGDIQQNFAAGPQSQPVLSAPVITSASVTTGTFGQPYVYDVAASGYPDPVFALAAAPVGMTIDPVTGVINWTPDVLVDQAVEVTATNSEGADSQAFTLTVLVAPAITSVPDTTGTLGQAYVYDVEAAGVPAPVFALSTAPAGMTIDEVSGVINWTPDVVGDQAVEVTATNSAGTDTQAFTLAVQAAPLITSTPVTAGTLGLLYEYDVEATGVPAPVFALVTAPAGMTIDPVTGAISWLPDVLGDQAMEVTATNSAGADTQSFTLTIQAAPNVPPVAAVASPTAGAVFQLGDPVPLAATATDTDGSVSQVEFLVDGAVVATLLTPPWQTDWIGGLAGSHSVVARATDNAGATGDSPAVVFSINDPSGPSRVTAGLVTLYNFASGGGTVVPDVSGVGTPLDLQINDPGAVTWLPGGGLSLDTATIVRTAGPATKVIDAAASTNAMTVEAWVTPASAAQSGPARIVTCSTDMSNRNFTLGQGVYQAGDDRFVMRFRTTETDNNGTPQTSTAVGTLTTDLTHVVYTRNAAGQVTIYLDGVPAQSGTIGGTSSNWNPSYAFALGNELTEDRPWLGAYYLVAVYDRALTPGDIQQNFAAGPQDQPAPATPVITSAPVTTGTFGQPYVYDVAASGYPDPVFALAAAPVGMTIDPVTGVINWTPDVLVDQGVEVTATNSEGADSQVFTLTVLVAPAITSVPETTGTFGQAYVYDVEASGVPAPSFALVTAPTGMTIDAVTGVINWTPDVVGDQAVEVTATNSAGTDTQAFTLAVQAAPLITSAPVTAGTLGLLYEYDVEATGVPAPVFALVTAPAGMTIDPVTGAISWLPDVLGDQAMEVTATNSAGFDNQAFTLSVQAAPNVPPVAAVTSPLLNEVFQLGDPVPLSATASDSDGTVAQVEFLVDGAVVETLTIPPWETVWNGGAAGSHQVVARATDNAGATGDSPAIGFSINDPNGPSRVTAGLVSLYDFATSGGTVVPDVSGVNPALDLTINDPGAVTWLPGGGLSLDTATIVRTAGPATKVIDAAASTNAMTVEAWVTPASVAQSGPARIVTCSTDMSNRNFTLGQGVYQAGDDRFVMRFRTTATDNNGTPQTSTAVGTLTTDLTHVVYTRNAAGQVTIYLDGVPAQSGTIGGTSSNWNPSYAFALGNELTEDRPWLGAYYLVAVYDRALTPGDIQQNFDAGPLAQPVLTAPVITSLPVTTGTFGQTYAYDVEASGSPAPMFALAQAPAGMTIDAVTGVIGWTPDALGDQTVEVTATNSEGADNQVFTLAVQPAPNLQPVAAVTNPAPGAVFQLGDPVPLAATATDNDGTVSQVEFLVDGAVVATLTFPPWNTVWNGGALGSHQVIARATDNQGATGDSPGVTFSINDPNGPSRVTAGLVALYDFDTGSGDMVPDISGVGAPLDLQIGNTGAVTWLPGGGLTLDSPTIVRSAGPATKVIDAAVNSNAITVEAWMAPGSVSQNGPARMVTCSGDPSNRNFTLGQGVYNSGDDRYLMRLRTTSTDNNGIPETATPVGSLTTDLTHVVYTRDSDGTVTIYLDGGLARSGFTGGECTNWDPSFAFALGNELTEDRPWLGTFYLVAVYDRALSTAEVGQNYTMGPQGQPVPLAPVVTSAPVTAGTLGQPYVYDAAASGYPLPVFALVQGPAGMTIDPATGVINWTPGMLGDVTVEVSATNSEGADSQAFLVSVYPDNPVQIAIWHGLDQRVGHLGPSQADFNVLGNVSPVGDVASLSFRVNGGVFQDLSIGPDNLRLVDSGDFNADVPLALLQGGFNTITIQALGTTGQVSSVDVNVTLENGGNYPLPTTISWNNVTNPQDVGQYVDGQWQLQGDALRILRQGYDRIFLIGDENWQDYEILVPITINGVFANDAGLGALMRFTGHIVGGHRNWPIAQPKWGYQPFGGIGWLRWTSGPTNEPTMQFYHGDFDAVDNFGAPSKLLSDPTTMPFGALEMTKDFGKATVALGSSYMMRMRCETLPDAPDGDGVTLYSWKIWETSTQEPAGWSWQVTQESQYALRQGGVALLAHHVDATFGDVQVTPVAGAVVLGMASKAAVDAEVHAFALNQNHPNPFNPITEIHFSLPRDGNATLKVYNVRGQLVTTLASGILAAGQHSVSWDASRHPSGVYFYRLEAPGFSETKKMIMVK